MVCVCVCVFVCVCVCACVRVNANELVGVQRGRHWGEVSVDERRGEHIDTERSAAVRHEQECSVEPFLGQF